MSSCISVPTSSLPPAYWAFCHSLSAWWWFRIAPLKSPLFPFPSGRLCKGEQTDSRWAPAAAGCALELSPWQELGPIEASRKKVWGERVKVKSTPLPGPQGFYSFTASGPHLFLSQGLTVSWPSCFPHSTNRPKIPGLGDWGGETQFQKLMEKGISLMAKTRTLICRTAPTNMMVSTSLSSMV